MNGWKFYSLICTLLFLAGLFTGQFFSFSGEQLDKAVKVTGIISSLGTIFGVLVAYLAFSSWKLQYRNAKLDQLIDDLEDAFNNLGQSIGQCYFSTLGVAKYHENAGTCVSYETLKNEEQRAKLNWFETRSIYQTSFNKLARHLVFTEIQAIEPKNIEIQAVKLFQNAHSVYKPNDIRESDKILNRNDELLGELLANGSNGFKQLRGKALLTSKKES